MEQEFGLGVALTKSGIIADNSLSELGKNIAISEITIKDPVIGKEVKMLHLDFAAVIEKDNGEEETVMIELQKSAYNMDIFRFKEYVCANFKKKRKVIKQDPDTGKDVEMDLPYRLIPIFILNFEIEYEINDLMIKTRQIKTGIFTGKELQGKNEFIDNLSYELFVVQLPYLRIAEQLDFEPNSYKGKLFALLKLFDQREKNPQNEHRLLLFPKLFPGFLERVIKRLQAADAENPDLEKQMQAEDHFLKLLTQQYNKVAWFRLNKKEMEKKLQEKDKVILNLAKALKDVGKSPEEINKITNLPQKVIERL